MLTLATFALSLAGAHDHPQTLVQLPERPDGDLRVELAFPDGPRTLVLHPDTVRSEDFQLFRQVPGGRYPIEAPASTLLTGVIDGDPDTLVSASLYEGRLTALVHDLEARSTQIVEPLDPYGPRTRSYVPHQVRPYVGGDFTCGCELLEGSEQASDRMFKALDELDPGTTAFSSTGTADMTLALDSTAELYAAYGGDEAALTAHMLATTHHAGVLLEAQLGFRLRVTSLVLRPDGQAAGYPYQVFSSYTNLILLHNDIRLEWNPGGNDQGPLDYAHLFSADYYSEGFSTIAGSQLDDICNSIVSWGVVTERPTSWSRMQGIEEFGVDVEILTHELGHGFEIIHTSGAEGSTGLMAPNINGEFLFSPTDLQLALDRIANNGACLDTGSVSFAPPSVSAVVPSAVEFYNPADIVVQGAALNGVYLIDFGSEVFDFDNFHQVGSTQLVITDLGGLGIGTHTGTLISPAGTASITLTINPVSTPALEAHDVVGLDFLVLSTWDQPNGFAFHIFADNPAVMNVLGWDVLVQRQAISGNLIALDSNGAATESWSYAGSSLIGLPVWFQGATYDTSATFAGATNIEEVTLGVFVP